jgi:hypothetical protein
MPGKENRSGKINQIGRGTKSINLDTDTKTDDLALANSMFLVPKEENEEITEEQIQNAVIYENGVTSLDFMLPDDEREILDKNLNNYSDMEKMKKALNLAKKNKLLSEDVKTLGQIAKADELINNMFDVMNNPENIEMINKYIRQKLENGQDVAKAYKEIGLMAKAMIDAREGMISKMKTNKSGKNMKIAIKFTNDSGEDFQLGADINE